jgi:hypothetical protein
LQQNENGMVNNCANTNDDEEDIQSVNYDHGNQDSETGKLFFTPAQHKALLALLQGSSSLPSHSLNHITTNSGIICTIPHSSDSTRFILDTGATDHVCHSIQYFQCLKEITPMNLKLPNGSIVSTCFAGTIVFDQNFFLTDVLYFPNFSFNLISVPKLTNNLHCTLLFDDHNCVIQDLYSKRMIGVAEMHNGLYLLKNPSVSLGKLPSTHCINSLNHLDTSTHHPSPLDNSKTIDCTLWHKRFGHASYDKLIEINKMFGGTFICMLSYDVVRSWHVMSFVLYYAV